MFMDMARLTWMELDAVSKAAFVFSGGVDYKGLASVMMSVPRRWPQYLERYQRQKAAEDAHHAELERQRREEEQREQQRARQQQEAERAGQQFLEFILNYKPPPAKPCRKRKAM